jgi:hypothetical protein
MMNGLLLNRNKRKKNSQDSDKGTSFLAIKKAQDLIVKANIDPFRD